jgi:hypothetical protein
LKKIEKKGGRTFNTGVSLVAHVKTNQKLQHVSKM